MSYTQQNPHNQPSLPSNPQSLPPVRLSPDEAEAVIRLWQQEQDNTAHSPSLADMAEGLGIPPEEVQRLLAEVRAAQPALGDVQHVRIAREHGRLRQRIAWATIAAGTALMAGAWLQTLLH